MTDPPRSSLGGDFRQAPLRRFARAVGPDVLLALALFVSLAALSWRRWASFDGDLNREWTTPARIAAGEMLYRDVAWYYGPLAPWVEGAVFRLLGARVGSVVAFDLVSAGGTIAIVLLASRRFLHPAGRAAFAATAVGVVAFAPENGSLIACYSQSALLAVGLSWLAFLLAGRGAAAGAGLAAGAALLSKAESLPAILVATAFAPRRRRPLLVATALLIAGTGYGIACAGLGTEELVRYGPLRHFRMPPEFGELYRRISGIHPDLLPRAVLGASAGAFLSAGWLLGVGGLLGGRRMRAALGAAALGVGGLLTTRLGSEPILTTLFRGIPFLAAAALVLALFRMADRSASDGERATAAAAAGAAIIGLSFAWRTALWTVPSYPYAPLAAVSSLPAVAWLVTSVAVSPIPAGRRDRAAWLLALPLLLAPLVFLPRLIVFYRSPRTEVIAPRGTWVPPDAQGELFSQLVVRLAREGVRDGQLVVLPEASALNFLLGVRSPLRLEQALPGLLDDGADEDAVRRLRSSRPGWVVLLPRATGEFGAMEFGRDYGRRLMAEINESYALDARVSTALQAGETSTALVLRRR